MPSILTLHTPKASAEYYRAGHWQKDSFFLLLKKWAEQKPEAWFVRDAKHRLNYAEALAWTESIAAQLERTGLRAGDRVAISMPNRVEAVLIFLACSRNGYLCIPSLHQNYTTKEVVALLERTRAKVLFNQTGYGVDGAQNERSEAAATIDSITAVFRLGADNDAGDVALDVAHPARAPLDDADKVVYLAFTSGTTGMPKAVMHSDNTLLANARPMVKDWGHNGGTVLLALSPLSHHNGWVALGQMLTAGGEIALNDPPRGMKPLDWIHETGATYLMGVPTHAIDVLAEIRRRGLKAAGKVKTWYIAGAPIPPDVSAEIMGMGITPQNVYGMTENSSHQYPLPTDSKEILTTTCGRANAGYEVRIFEPENKDVEVPVGAVGEIGGRGACLMLGYFDNQKATEESFNADGWFMTGDLGVLDADGNLKIVGRVKDVIIRGGHNIFPAHIENLAMQHPAILKAAAFPVPDARLGERVCLALTFNPGQSLSGDEVLAHLRDVNLSKYDMPEYMAVINELPTTASGKILKRELVVMVDEGRLTPQPISATVSTKA
jgi:acyl-CoA synthetase